MLIGWKLKISGSNSLKIWSTKGSILIERRRYDFCAAFGGPSESSLWVPSSLGCGRWSCVLSSYSKDCPACCFSAGSTMACVPIFESTRRFPRERGFIIFRFCCYLADLKMCFFLSPNVYWRWLLNDSFIIMNLPTYKLLFFSKDSLLLPILTANSIFYLYSWSSPRGGEWRLISSFFSVLPSKFCRIL